MSNTRGRAIDEAEKPADIQRFVRLREVTGDIFCLKHPQAGMFGAQLRTYRAVLQVSCIHFHLMSDKEQEAILAGYRVLIHSLRSHGIDIHIRIEPYDLEKYQERIREAESPAPHEEVDAHLNFLYSLATKRALIQRRFYLIVPADDPDPRTARRRSPEELLDVARSQLHLRCEKIREELTRIGLTSCRLSDEQLVNYYRACWHSSAARAYPLSLNQIQAADHIIRPEREQSIKPIVQRRSHRAEPLTMATQRASLPDLVRLAEIVVPSSMQVERSHLVVNAYGLDEYISGIAVVGLPAFVDDGFLARLIGIDEPGIDLYISLRPQHAEAYKAKLRRKLIGYKGTQRFDERRGRSINHDINVASEEVNQLLDDLARQVEYVYSQRMHLLVRAHSRTELREREQRLFAMLTTLELQAVSTSWEHHLALRATLPEGNGLFSNEKILDTSSVVTGFPFIGETMSTDTGMLVGLGPDGNLIMLDPFSEELENANQTVFAKSGAGKSFDIKVSIYRSWLQGIASAVIDPEREYLPLCRRIRGEYVILDDTNLKINPFDLFSFSDTYERNIIEEKATELLPLFEGLLAESGGSLSKTETSLLYRVMLQAYHDCGITADPATHGRRAPYMGTISTSLKYSGEDRTHLADRLERYIALFPARTEVNLDSQSLFFSIRDLHAELRPTAIFLITSYIWTQMRRSRESARKWLLYIDEAWSLLELKQGGSFLANIARRARKYGLGVVCVTQNVEDFLNNPHGRTILSNSSITILMRQAPETIDSVTTAFHLSESERKYVLSAGKGQALISVRGVRVPLQVVASPLEYAFAVSNPAEVRTVTEARSFSDERRDVASGEDEVDDDDTIVVPLEEVTTARLSLENERAVPTSLRYAPLAGGIDEESA